MEALTEVFIVVVVRILTPNITFFVMQDVTDASTGKKWDLDTQDSPEAQTASSRIIIQRTS